MDSSLAVFDATDSVHHERMLEAVELAQNALIKTSPNPRVGCVIYTVDGQKVGWGITQPPGGDHAEIQALKRLYSHPRFPALDPRHLILYVTLEPCTHYGRTPPCVLALLDSGIQTIFIGLKDPNPVVYQKGINQLIEAGRDVYVGVEKEACWGLHAPFCKWIQTKRPWVSLKGAMTLDGCLATASGHSKWITNPQAREDVHDLRSQVDAILVGGQTARLDRPRLNVRLVDGDDPLVVVMTRFLNLPKDLPCARPGSLFFHCAQAPKKQIDFWKNKGVIPIEVSLNQSGYLSIPEVLDHLGQRGVNHLLVEGGGRIHGAFIEEEVVDDLYLYVAPKIIGRGMPLFQLPSVPQIQKGVHLSHLKYETCGQDLRIYGRFPTAFSIS